MRTRTTTSGMRAKCERDGDEDCDDGEDDRRAAAFKAAQRWSQLRPQRASYKRAAGLRVARLSWHKQMQSRPPSRAEHSKAPCRDPKCYFLWWSARFQSGAFIIHCVIQVIKYQKIRQVLGIPM